MKRATKRIAVNGHSTVTRNTDARQSGASKRSTTDTRDTAWDSDACEFRVALKSPTVYTSTLRSALERHGTQTAIKKSDVADTRDTARDDDARQFRIVESSVCYTGDATWDVDAHQSRTGKGVAADTSTLRPALERHNIQTAASIKGPTADTRDTTWDGEVL